MDDMQPPITPQFMAQLPQTPPEQPPVQQYIYIATIQRYPMPQQGIQIALPQPPSMAPEWQPHISPAAGQHHVPMRSLYLWPLNMPRYANKQHHIPKAISEGPGVGETLLGCGMLLIVGTLILLLLYYLSAAR